VKRAASPLERALADAGGVRAARDRSAQLGELLERELARGVSELAGTRSGYGQPVEVAFASGAGSLVAALPADPALRADPAAVPERGWLVVAAAVGALVEAAGAGPPADAGELRLLAGRLGAFLALSFAPGDAELAALAYDDRTEGVDRLRTQALALPGHALEGVEDLRAPIGSTHPLRVAEAVARLGGDPSREADVEALEDAVFALLERPDAVIRAHDDPEPVRRVARRILQRLDGMGKWGGYHTEFTHVSRGFGPGNEQRLALEVGERLVEAGLLVAKTSVGQRHVFLNPRRSAEIRALIDKGIVPSDLRLPG
jgi:hypothetical protein